MAMRRRRYQRSLPDAGEPGALRADVDDLGAGDGVLVEADPQPREDAPALEPQDEERVLDDLARRARGHDGQLERHALAGRDGASVTPDRFAEPFVRVP